MAQRLSGAFIVFGALVAGAFLVTVITFGIGTSWLRPELQQSRQAERAENSSHAAVLEAENGLRGYLISRDPRYLEPYSRRQSGIGIGAGDETPIASIDAAPGLAAALLSTRLAEQKWSEGWGKSVANAGRYAPAPSMSAGQQLFDAYKQSQATLAQALQHRTQELSQREQWLVTVRVTVELAVFAVILLFAMRQHRALHNGIVTPVAALLLHIRRIRDGHFEAVVDKAAPRELAELAQGLNEVVRALVTARETAASRDEALSEHSIRLHQILDASREFSESLNLAYVVDSVRESTATIGGYEQVIVWLMDDEKKRIVNSQESPLTPHLDDPVLMGKGLASRAAKAGRTTFEGPAGQVRFGDSSNGPVRAIAIPLIVGARVVGVLEARHAEARVATKDVIEILEMLATHAATAIESARLHEVIEERSQVDALTRLLNRRRLEEDLDAECKRCVRYGRPLAFVMLDVDHFKAVNDTLGHPKADTALQAVADVIVGCTRTTDTAYRYGGEEFCVMLRETTADDAMHFAERLRQRIEHRFASGEVTRITASFGVAEFSADFPTPRALVEAADAAMYESKHAGRNRVALSVRPPLPLP